MISDHITILDMAIDCVEKERNDEALLHLNMLRVRMTREHADRQPAAPVSVQKLVEMVQAGLSPVVRFKTGIEIGTYAEKGMIARITKLAHLDHEMVELYFHFDEFRANNEPLETHDWYGKDGVADKTAREVGWLDNGVESIYLMLDDVETLELAVENETLRQYLLSGSTLTYTQWLEKLATASLNERPYFSLPPNQLGQ